jgi:hypothetical protein
MLASTSLGKERVEGIISAANGFVAWHLTIWLNAVLQAEKLPASIPNLHAGLAKMEAECFTHGFV